MPSPIKETRFPRIFPSSATLCLLLALSSACALAQSPAGPPPSSAGIFPLSEVHRGLHGTAWTVFEGTQPEPMDVEILGLLHGGRGPGQDMILARLHGTKPEYTGVVAGMSGSPVYIDGRLLGALSYRIGQFSKEPIAGITPIQEMLDIRDLPTSPAFDSAPAPQPESHTASNSSDPSGTMTFQAMETPLLMSGFSPQAIDLWRRQMTTAGQASLATVSAGGPMGSSGAASQPESPIIPGSAVSLQLVRGDLEIAATCTVTWVDPKQLLACGHPVLQAGPISVPMTAAEVLATLPSPLNAFKIINTGRTLGAFTQDRASAIFGEFGIHARMIPVHFSVSTPSAPTSGHQIEVLDQPEMTASALLVSLYQTLLETNASTAATSYHLTGSITLAGRAPLPIDAWGTPQETMASQLAAAFAIGDIFNRIYANAGRTTPITAIDLNVQAIDRDLRIDLESARLISSGIVHAGDTVTVEATLRPVHGPAVNLRLPVTLPARLEPGNLRLLISGAATLDRTADATRPQGRTPSLNSAWDRLTSLHAPDQLYVTLLLPESQAAVDGATLASLPLSIANTLEPGRGTAESGLHGETLSVAAQAPAGGVLSGQQLLTLRVEPGGGLH